MAQPDITDMLIADNKAMRTSGLKLAQAALRVIDECDGLHRLSLAVADWSKTIANEGGRPHEVGK